MKKFLLIMVAVAFTMNASAQFVAAEKVSQPKAIMTSERMEAAFTASMAPRKTIADGVLYSRPEGTFWLSWDKEGSGYYQSFLMVPPFTDINFKNISTATGDAAWTVNNKAYDAEEDGSFDFGSLDVQDAFDAPGGISYYPMPTLTVGRASFTLQGVGSTKSSSFTSYASGISVDTLNAFTLFDCHNTTYIGWGIMSPSAYLYGSGHHYSSGAQCVGVFQDYPKPAAPLYIQDAYADCLSNLEVPIPDGKELSLVFVELDDEGNETENVLGTMTATSASVEWDKNEDGTYYKFVNEENLESGEAFTGQMLFEQKEVDIFGQETVSPVIINTPFRIYLLGLDEEGDDIGFSGRLVGDESAIEGSVILLQDGDEIRATSYTSGISLPLSFTAMYDVAMLLDTDTGVYTAPVEGGVVTREDDAEYDAAYVYTAYPWTDNLGNDNYFLYVEYPEGDPEWITTNVDTQYWNQTDSNGNQYAINIIEMTAEPLPDGIEGRYATVYVYGPAAEVSYVVKQGEVTAIKGVTVNDENSKFAGATYNLAGQKVGADYKGIVIENGKKVVKK